MGFIQRDFLWIFRFYLHRWIKQIVTANFLEIRYLYFLKVFQWIKHHFCVSNQKLVISLFKVYPNRHLYLHTFLRKTPWKLYDPFITFRLQMWRMNYMHISESLSIYLWNVFVFVLGCFFGGTCLKPLICRHLFSKVTSKKVSWEIHGSRL